MLIVGSLLSPLPVTALRCSLPPPPSPNALRLSKQAPNQAAACSNTSFEVACDVEVAVAVVNSFPRAVEIAYR